MPIGVKALPIFAAIPSKMISFSKSFKDIFIYLWIINVSGTMTNRETSFVIIADKNRVKNIKAIKILFDFFKIFIEM